MTVDEAINAMRREYYAKHRERILANKKKNREKDKDAFNAKRRAYAAKNREQIRELNRAGRLRRVAKKAEYDRKRRENARLQVGRAARRAGFDLDGRTGQGLQGGAGTTAV